MKPIELVNDFMSKGVKIRISKPGDGHLVKVITTEKYLIVYRYKPSSYYNFGGSHYYYIHDIVTGSFINSANSVTNLKPLQTEFFRIKNYNEALKLYENTLEK